MSEHTQGRIKAIRWVDGLSALQLEESSGRYFGGVPVVDLIGGSITDANARRLAAAWNACENIGTESLETGATLAEICERSNGYVVELNAANTRIASLESQLAERDAWLGQRPCRSNRCSELNAARALLREVIAENDSGHPLRNISDGLADSIRAHIDACDTLEGK